MLGAVRIVLLPCSRLPYSTTGPFSIHCFRCCDGDGNDYVGEGEGDDEAADRVGGRGLAHEAFREAPPGLIIKLLYKLLSLCTLIKPRSTY